MPAILALGRLKQEKHELETSLGSVVRPLSLHKEEEGEGRRKIKEEEGVAFSKAPGHSHGVCFAVCTLPLLGSRERGTHLSSSSPGFSTAPVCWLTHLCLSAPPDVFLRRLCGCFQASHNDVLLLSLQTTWSLLTCRLDIKPWPVSQALKRSNGLPPRPHCTRWTLQGANGERKEG